MRSESVLHKSGWLRMKKDEVCKRLRKYFKELTGDDCIRCDICYRGIRGQEVAE